MLTLLFSKAGLIGAGIVALLGVLATMLGYARKAGKDAQKAAEADAYAKHLQEIQDAANARPTGSVQSDPFNRDNQK